jgi:ribosomal-protein-alanine N-acetyltransferase
MFTNLETERLFLRCLDKSYRDFIFEEFKNDFINKYLYDEEPMTDISDADELIGFYMEPEPRNQNRWVLVDKKSGIKLGTCGVHVWNRASHAVEIGFELMQEFNGKGYMLEAAKAIISFAQQKMKIKKILAQVFIENQKCIHLLEKLEFRKSGEKETEFSNQIFMHDIYELNL